MKNFNNQHVDVKIKHDHCLHNGINKHLLNVYCDVDFNAYASFYTLRNNNDDRKNREKILLIAYPTSFLFNFNFLEKKKTHLNLDMKNNNLCSVSYIRDKFFLKIKSVSANTFSFCIGRSFFKCTIIYHLH